MYGTTKLSCHLLKDEKNPDKFLLGKDDKGKDRVANLQIYVHNVREPWSAIEQTSDSIHNGVCALTAFEHDFSFQEKNEIKKHRENMINYLSIQN